MPEPTASAFSIGWRGRFGLKRQPDDHRARFGDLGAARDTHKVPLLWRLHQVHHADVDIDVTTAIRFHPVEIALSMLWKIVCVLALAQSLLAVVLFEIILNAGAMFSHANIRTARSASTGFFARVIVTPDMHRVHHSVIRREHGSNFGFNLSVWDRIVRHVCRKPEKGHDAMTIGLPAYQSDEPTRLDLEPAFAVSKAAKGT